MSLLKACADCGDLTTRARCTSCRPPDHEGKSSTQRGYDSAWQRLSRRARRAQPFCTDCGTTKELSVDHTPQAWARHEAGLEIRLEDVAVVCITCNNRRGAARGPQTRGDDPLRDPLSPSGKAEFQLVTGELLLAVTFLVLLLTPAPLTVGVACDPVPRMIPARVFRHGKQVGTFAAAEANDQNGDETRHHNLYVIALGAIALGVIALPGFVALDFVTLGVVALPVIVTPHQGSIP